MYQKVILSFLLVFISVVVNVANSNAEKYLFDFTTDSSADIWQEQSDTVRTVGRSKATLVIHKNTDYRRAVFFALLNPVNGAGFAGVRAIQTYNLTGYKNFQINCRGQGEYNGFKVVLRHKGLNDASSYTYEQFFDGPDDFAVQTLPFSGFAAYFRGQIVNNAEPIDWSQVSSFGLQMYAGFYLPVNQSGPATLEINWIKAV